MVYELVDYKCLDGDCLMLWETGCDSKLGALSPDHREIGEAIVEELNKYMHRLENIDEYIEDVEKVNEHLRNRRDRLEEECSILRIKNKSLTEENERLYKDNNEKVVESISIIEFIDKKIDDLIQSKRDAKKEGFTGLDKIFDCKINALTELKGELEVS